MRTFAARTRLVRCAMGCAALLALAGCRPPVPLHHVQGNVPALILTQIPIDSLRAMSPNAPRRMPLGSRVVLVEAPGTREQRVTNLTAGFAAACDPCVLFSGDTLAFAAKRTASDRWDIWRMPLGVPGATPQRVTHGLGDCREPYFLALSALTPPNFTDKVRWIGFTSTAGGALDESGRGPASALWCQSLDTVAGQGIVTWRTTFNLGSDFSPTVLADGRTLFTSSRYDGGHPYPIAGLIASDWSGTGLNAFYGLHHGARVKSQACELPERREVVFVESNGRTPLDAGSLARVLMARPLATYEHLGDARGLFLTPHGLPGGGLVAAYAPDSIHYGIRRIDPETGALGRVIFDEPNWANVDPQPVERYPEPQGRITIVVASRSTGDIQCLNVYDSTTPAMRHAKRGTVVRVRVVEGLPAHEPDRGPDTLVSRPAVRVIGEAPVQPDGSFFLRLPADTPISFQLLDSDGVAIESMQSWVWVRRGSRRGCIGCHENKELVPENRLTDALRIAKPSVLLAAPSARRTVDFQHDIAPVVSHVCATCHHAGSRSGLDLVTGGPEAVYARLVTGRAHDGTPLVVPGNARGSMLAFRLYGRRLDGTPGDLRRMPLKGTLPDSVVRTVAEWIDLGARFDNREATP